VRSDTLVIDHVHCDGNWLTIGDQLPIDLNAIRRIAVVGAGKAGLGMAMGLEAALADCCEQKQLTGWINVPADCVQTLDYVQLHAARPAGLNEPTEEGVRGTERILQIVSELGPGDLCFCLISGGGSALLPAPAVGVTLQQKQQITQFLSASGANIQELNTVRKQLSRVKGGRLAAACNAGLLSTLIISDVIGDPLDVIASGPTVADSSTPTDAIHVLNHFAADQNDVPPTIFEYLKNAPAQPIQSKCKLTHLVIGNNASAVDAAGVEAEKRGYSHAMVAASNLEGAAEEVGLHLLNMARQMAGDPNGPDCLISGGEPIVKLVPAERRGKGGRNQQLVLAALCDAISDSGPLERVTILAAGTDGEDGPTDAAGAWIDGRVVATIRERDMDPQSYLDRNDAYHLFAQTGSLLITGPTNTNVCDLRVVVIER